MKRFLIGWLVGFSISILCTASNCDHVTPPTPTVDAKPDYAALCAHLRDIGCSEGAAPNCAQTFAIFEGDRMAQLHPSCLMDASSIVQARACGSVACP